MNASNHGKATNRNSVSVHVCVLAQSDAFFVYVTGYVCLEVHCPRLYVYINGKATLEGGVHALCVCTHKCALCLLYAYLCNTLVNVSMLTQS